MTSNDKMQFNLDDISSKGSIVFGLLTFLRLQSSVVLHLQGKFYYIWVLKMQAFYSYRADFKVRKTNADSFVFNSCRVVFKMNF